MNFNRIAHLAFKVSDMDAALAFYCDKLGFKHKFDLEDNSGNPWIVYLEIAPKQFVELFYGKPEPKGQTDTANGYLHLSLEVPDIKETKAWLLRKGVTPDSEIGRGKDRSYQLWVSDPDGNKIEFMQYTDQSRQLE